MRFISIITLTASLALAPLAGHAATLHPHWWEQYKAGRAFKHLSADGQKAFGDILKAHDLLVDGKTDAAIPPLYDARKRLVAASKDSAKFNAAETALQPAPQHVAAAGHVASTTPTDWVPVGGEFIVTETLAPEKKAAIATANKQLQSGNTQQAAQNMQVVGEDADFIVALAPIVQTQGALNRAIVFTEGRQAKEAVAALEQALGSIVFVSQDFVDTALPDGKNASAPAVKK